MRSPSSCAHVVCPFLVGRSVLPLRAAVLALLLVVGFAGPVQAATFVVNDLGDMGDANPGDGQALTPGGVTTLRAAIEEANETMDMDSVQFDAAVFSEPSTILLNGQFLITESLIIEGPGAGLLTLDGRNNFGILKAFSGVSLELYDVTLAQGRVVGSTMGGALEVSGPSLLVSGCVFANNRGESGGAACFASGCSVEMYDCVFSSNRTLGTVGYGDGAALYTEYGDLQLTRCAFNGNICRGSGAAVYLSTLAVGFTDCSFINNTAVGAGTVYCLIPSSNLTFTGCTFSGNAVEDSAGAILAFGTTKIVNCTLVQNRAGRRAGALAASNAATILNTTICGNEADTDLSGNKLGGGIYVWAPCTLQIGNSIVANNSDHNTAGQDVSGTVSSLGGNLIGIGDGNTGFTASGDQVGTAAAPINPALRPLADNGGPTQTCMPLSSSPALNAGLNELIANPPFEGPPFYDQRGEGFLRIFDTTVDIGAVERELPADVTPPVITLLGDAALLWECGVSFVDPGATALDDLEGDLTADITVSGTVDTATPGEYTLTYNLSDSEGNAAVPVTRTVTVQDTTPPVITLLGDAAMQVECHMAFPDPGATALDSCDMALPAVAADVSGLNLDAPGVYPVVYNVADVAGNPATPVIRNVTVVDTTPPALSLEGNSDLLVECHTSFADPGATALDACDAALPAVQVDTASFNIDVPGVYVMTYTVADASGNPAVPVTRTVTVQDTTPPLIMLLGDAEITVECHTALIDPGAAAADTCDVALPPVTADASTVNVDVPGAYSVVYNVADAAGNAAAPVTRVVHVADATAPVITLTGDSTVTMACNSEYVDLGATAADACDTALDSVGADTSALDTSTAGLYSVMYTIEDASGNAATPVTRTVIVEGPCAPPHHTADQDGDNLINLTELLRVIQFFNSGGFHCQEGTEDGYAPGPVGDTTCAAHDSDYMPQDWQVTLSELLRVIQFFNSGGYHACPDATPPTEDGYCVGAS